MLSLPRLPTSSSLHLVLNEANIEWRASPQHQDEENLTHAHNEQYHIQIFISIQSHTRVYPSPQEQRKLLTHEGNQHHGYNMNEV